jgi:hypothetical protein
MSAKPVAEKPLIKPHTTVWLSPAEHRERVGPLPEGMRLADGPGEARMARSAAALSAKTSAILAAHQGRLARPDTFWVAYPKANRADINRDTLWPILADCGMRPIGQVAVDEVWSALRFRPLTEGEAPFAGGR